MSVFDDLVDQEDVVAELRRAAGDPVAMTHAWLLTGPAGSGRSTAARAFAAALQCERAPAEPGCGDCPACRLVRAGSHPDVRVVATQETFIRVDLARELAFSAGYRPSLGRRRVIVVEDADRLNDQAADALLRAVEEPPENTVWLLCAPSSHDVIVTIRSRCRHVRLRMPSPDAVASLLQRRDGIDAGLAHYAARAAQSHIGLARHLATDETARARRHTITALPASVRSLGDALSAAADLHELATQDAAQASGDDAARAREDLLRSLGADPSARTQPPAVRTQLTALTAEQKRRDRRRAHDVLDRTLSDLATVYRDALIVQSGAGVELVNGSETSQIHEVARAFTPEQLLAALDQIGLARARLVANGAPLLVLEAMMVALTVPGKAA